MSDLASIPFDWIAEDLQEGNIIPFLGAGASLFPKDLNRKPPSASALARQLAESSLFPASPPLEPVSDRNAQLAHFRGEMDRSNLSLVASWVEHVRGDRRRLRDSLRRSLAPSDGPLPFSALHDSLARCAKDAPMAVVTTNYDDLMESAFERHGVSYDLSIVEIGSGGRLLFRAHQAPALTPVAGEGQLLSLTYGGGSPQLARSALFKLHGHVSARDHGAETFVITEEDYVTFLGQMGGSASLIPADLIMLMQRRSLLFLGYGLRDWNLRVLLERITRLQQQGTPDGALRSYAVARGLGAAEQALWRKRNVEVFDVDLNDVVARLRDKLVHPPFQAEPTP